MIRESLKRDNCLDTSQLAQVGGGAYVSSIKQTQDVFNGQLEVVVNFHGDEVHTPYNGVDGLIREALKNDRWVTCKETSIEQIRKNNDCYVYRVCSVQRQANS